ncbi:MAG: hypothetical protein QE267_02200 [Akkermansiaceae bacterium]|nr:hypothetical protein [Akkermansiaceae bacterium]
MSREIICHDTNGRLLGCGTAETGGTGLSDTCADANGNLNLRNGNSYTWDSHNVSWVHRII